MSSLIQFWNNQMNKLLKKKEVHQTKLNYKVNWINVIIYISWWKSHWNRNKMTENAICAEHVQN